MDESGYKPSVEDASRAATLLDVSRHTGLSTATISRVLNNNPNVRATTRTRVLDAIKALGYRANHSARALARQRTDTIGVIFPHIDSGFYSEVLKGVHEVAAMHNLHLAVAFALDADDQPKLVRGYLQGGRVDALILMNLGMPEDFIRDLAQGRTPIVLIDRPVRGARVATVQLDNVSGADAAMSHLLELGHQRIAIIKGPAGTFDAEQRWLGCLQAARRAEVELDNELIWHGDFHDESGYQVMRRWLSRGQPLPDAIFAFNDPMAMGVIRALQERGLGVPHDVALVGFDDTESARYLGLTTVRSPMRSMGRAASAAVMSLLDSEPREAKNQLLPTELIVRTSCGGSVVLK